MKTTVEIPDELFRQVKAEAIFQGITFKGYLHDILLRRHELFRSSQGEVSATPQKIKEPQTETRYDVVSPSSTDLHPSEGSQPSVDHESLPQASQSASSAHDGRSRRKLPAFVTDDLTSLPRVHTAEVKAIEASEFLDRYGDLLKRSP